MIPEKVKSELVLLGAIKRLQDINKEREYLLSIINGHSPKKVKRVKKLSPSKKGFSYKGKHWTQTPEGREKMRQINNANYMKKQQKSESFDQNMENFTHNPSQENENE